MPDQWFRKDLMDHKRKIANHMGHASAIILENAVNHDADKIENEIIYKSYSKYAQGQKATPWGTKTRIDFEDKYMDEAIELHLQNKHHLQSDRNHSDDIDLFDVIEMLCDWIASMERDNLTKDEQFERIEKIYDSKTIQKIFVEKTVFLNTARKLLYYK